MIDLPRPAPGFDDPLGLLAACHERILHHCELLEKLVAHVRRHGADAQAEAAAASVRRYFSTAAHHHHDDEEEDLFPLLAHDAGMRTLIERLRAEHTILDQAWKRLEPQLQTAALGDAAALEAAVVPFAAAYRAHVATENAELLPRARELLNAAQCQQLGRAMAARRDVAPE
jgi:hemerythrin-like domain-containing protein